MSLDVCQRVRRVRHVSEHHALLVVVLAQDLVVAQVKAVPHAESGTKESGITHLDTLKILVSEAAYSGGKKKVFGTRKTRNEFGTRKHRIWFRFRKTCVWNIQN